MAYEGQIAGVGDRPPGRRLRGAAIRFMQRRSAAELRSAARGDRRRRPRGRRPRARQRRRHRQPRADRGRGRGDRGRGRLRASTRPCCSTTTAASRSRRRPASRCRSCGGPGRASRPRSAAATSPRAAATPSRLPHPVAARGPASSTPRRAPARSRRRCSAQAADDLRIGDRAYLRHAKAGELCERFDSLYLRRGRRDRRRGADLPRRGQDLPLARPRGSRSSRLISWIATSGRSETTSPSPRDELLQVRLAEVPVERLAVRPLLDRDEAERVLDGGEEPVADAAVLEPRVAPASSSPARSAPHGAPPRSGHGR